MCGAGRRTGGAGRDLHLDPLVRNFEANERSREHKRRADAKQRHRPREQHEPHTRRARAAQRYARPQAREQRRKGCKSQHHLEQQEERAVDARHEPRRVFLHALARAFQRGHPGLVVACVVLDQRLSPAERPPLPHVSEQRVDQARRRHEHAKLNQVRRAGGAPIAQPRSRALPRLRVSRLPRALRVRHSGSGSAHCLVKARVPAIQLQAEGRRIHCVHHVECEPAECDHSAPLVWSSEKLPEHFYCIYQRS